MHWLEHNCRPDPIETKLLGVTITVAEHTLIKSPFTRLFNQLLAMAVAWAGRVMDNCPECRRHVEMEYTDDLIHSPDVLAVRVGHTWNIERGEQIPR
jgi:hypothetical protein